MKTILVTGGAGYIGSITVRKLLKKGYKVIVFDNLSRGYKEFVPCKLIKGDLTKYSDLERGLGKEKIDAVIHFAALALVSESMIKPYEYYSNNVGGGINLLKFMGKNNINKIVFSSSCSIFGTPKKVPVKENFKKNPESVYAETKHIFENILAWYDKIHGIKYINLRYFNAAGASLDGEIGELHNPETHIIPLAIETALGNRNEFVIYGDDYSTKDGTCVRDYIHVEDLATAHILALEKLKDNISDSFNIGTGKGYSNKEILEMVKKISGVSFPIKTTSRRFGDPSQIFADVNKAKKILGFTPMYSDLETIVKTAWKWHKKND